MDVEENDGKDSFGLVVGGWRVAPNGRFTIMKRWEYLWTDDWGESRRLGREGWELVAVVYTPRKGNDYYFKRPLVGAIDGDDSNHYE